MVQDTRHPPQQLLGRSLLRTHRRHSIHRLRRHDRILLHAHVRHRPTAHRRHLNRPLHTLALQRRLRIQTLSQLLQHDARTRRTVPHPPRHHQAHAPDHLLTTRHHRQPRHHHTRLPDDSRKERHDARQHRRRAMHRTLPVAQTSTMEHRTRQLRERHLRPIQQTPLHPRAAAQPRTAAHTHLLPQRHLSHGTATERPPTNSHTSPTDTTTNPSPSAAASTSSAACRTTSQPCRKHSHATSTPYSTPTKRQNR